MAFMAASLCGGVIGVLKALVASHSWAITAVCIACASGRRPVIFSIRAMLANAWRLRPQASPTPHPYPGNGFCAAPSTFGAYACVCVWGGVVCNVLVFYRVNFSLLTCSIQSANESSRKSNHSGIDLIGIENAPSSGLAFRVTL